MLNFASVAKIAENRSELLKIYLIHNNMPDFKNQKKVLNHSTLCVGVH